MYYIKNKLPNGDTVRVLLDCEEEYGYLCSTCGEELGTMDTDEFIKYVEEYGMYGVNWACDKCPKALKASDKKEIVASTYHMNYADADGISHKVELTGEETFSTTCPECCKEHFIDFDDFIAHVGCELYGTSLYCAECSAKRVMQK